MPEGLGGASVSQVDTDEGRGSLDVPSARSEPSSTERPHARWPPLRPSLLALTAFIVYLVAAVLLWGLPVLAHLSTRYMAMDRELGDPDFYRWALAWTPWALVHGSSPLFTDRVFAPLGTSLSWSAFAPGPALLAWPVTRMFGSLVSYNLMMLIAPALAAWATFLLCHRVTRSFWPSLLGGWLFATSAYVAGQMQHNLPLVLIFPVPLLTYLVVRRIERSLGTGTFVAAATSALVGLFLTSTEMFAATMMFGLLALGIAVAAAGREERRRVTAASSLVAICYLITACVLFVPYLWPALQKIPARPVRNIDVTSADLLGFIVPRSTVLIGGSALASVSDRFTANVTSDASYVGIAGLALMAGFWFTERRRPATVPLLVFIAITALLALGPVLHIAGRPALMLPGAILPRLPILSNALPERFPVYAALAFSVVVALWLAATTRRSGWIRWALAILTAITLLPDVGTPPWHFSDRTPAFFADGRYASVLVPNETVFIVSTSKAEGMAWQSVADFSFRMAGGYVGPSGVFNQGEPLTAGLNADGRYVPTPMHLATYLACHSVTAVVMSDPAWPRFGGLLADAGLTTVYQGDGVSVWRPIGWPNQAHVADRPRLRRCPALSPGGVTTPNP